MTSFPPDGVRRVDILGCRVDVVDTDGAVTRVLSFLRDGRPAQVVTFGVEMAMLAQRDAAYRDTVNGADLVVPDSVGIVWAARRLGAPLRERVAGIDLVERLFEAADVPAYLLGAADGAAREAADALRAGHPRLRIAGFHHGYFDDAESGRIADEIRSLGARLVLVALGFPRQEFWIRDNLRRLGPAVCIGVGGALDVWAGRVERAPAAWRSLGLEWLYRLVTEPRRFRRQLALPAFALRVLARSISARRPTR